MSDIDYEGVMGSTYVSKVSIQYFYITVDDFKCDKFVILRTNSADEEQGGITTVYDLGI